MKKALIVGSGFAGSIFARKLAEEHNFKVDLIEERDHVGGNMYDEFNKYGVLIQKYGPHNIGTNNYDIIEFLNQYSELTVHFLRATNFINGKYIRTPFNFESVLQLVKGKKADIIITKMKKYFNGTSISIVDMLKHKDEDIKWYARLIYKKSFKNYVRKKWNLKPKELNKSVFDRVKIKIGYEERYTEQDYQYVPKDGYAKMFENMLKHKNINVFLRINAIEKISFENDSVMYDNKKYNIVVFTGAIDELFDFKFGSLPYKSLHFKYKSKKTNSILPSDMVSYPTLDIPYIRKTEYNKINSHIKSKYATIGIEYPMEYNRNAKKGNLPYYPIITKENLKLYKKYKKLSKRYKNLVLCGRLADYKYYNMDKIIELTLKKYEKAKVKFGL